MNYYYINTDTDALGYSPHAKWIKHNHAFTSGDYEQYGEQVLGTLNVGDMLFMYVKQCGVVAVGRVSESWDRCTYEGESQLIYQEIGCEEYRIGVDWCHKVVDNPISLDDLRTIIGRTPRRTLERIKDADAAERLLKEIQSR